MIIVKIVTDRFFGLSAEVKRDFCYDAVIYFTHYKYRDALGSNFGGFEFFNPVAIVSCVENMKKKHMTGRGPAANVAGTTRFGTAERFQPETCELKAPADNSSVRKSDDLKTVNL